jgi:Domain of unknown function (DUF5919)
VPASPSPRWPPKSALTPRRLSDGSSSGAFPTARIAGPPRRCWGPTRHICGPSSPRSDLPRRASTSELVTLYPNGGAVPGPLWRSLLEATSDRIDVLVFAGLFLPDGYPEIAKLLASKAEQGTTVRLILGDPDSDAVRRRGEEERIGDGLAARVRLGLMYLRDAIGAPGVELRFHATTLYNSIYRFDDDMLVNAHVYGAPAAHSPVLHLRRLPGGQLFDHYQASFERVWEQASTENVPAVLAQGGGR